MNALSRNDSAAMRSRPLLVRRRIEWGAILLIVALGIGVGARWAATSHGPRPHRRAVGHPHDIAPRVTSSAQPERVEAVLAILRARRAAGAPIEEITATLDAFSRHNPTGALDVAQWLARDASERHALVGAVLADWAEREPDAAWHWALATGTACDVPGATPLPAEVLAHIAARDPKRAVTLLGSLLQQTGGPGSINLSTLACDTLAAVMERGGTDMAWEALRAWSTAPQAEWLGRDAFERVAARESPANAAARLASLPPSSGRNFALGEVVAAWAAREPRAALGWTQQLPAENRADAAAAAFARWEANDPMAAAEWLGGNASDAGSDRMIAHLVSDPRVVRSDLHAALSLAESVGDSRLRRQAIESVVRRWAEEDPRAAANYVANQSMLSAEEKRQIVAALEPNPF